MSDFDISGVLRIDTSDLDSMLGRVGGAMNKIAGLAAGAFAVDKIAEWGKAGLKAAGEYEQTEVAFRTLLGSADKATAFMKDMRDFALKTPFDFPGIADASKKLLGYGFAAKDVIPMMTDVGNAASSLGVNTVGINGFVRAIGQMRGKGKVSADEIRQISENFPGFNSAATIAAYKGHSIAETFDLMQKGAIGAEEGIAAILQGMHNYPGAAGAMDAMNKTLLGSTSMLKETIRLAAVDVFDPYMPAITFLIRGLASAIQNTIVPAMKAGSVGLFNFAKTIRRVFGPSVKFAADAFDGFTRMIRGARINIDSEGNLFGALLGFRLLRLKDTVDNVVDDIRSTWDEFALGFRAPDIIFGADAVDGRITRLGSSLRKTFDETRGYLTDWVNEFSLGFRNPGLTEGPDAFDSRVNLLGASIKQSLNGAVRQFQLFGMGIRGTLTTDDSKPMYELGKAVSDTAKRIQDEGPAITGYWKNDLKPTLEDVGRFIQDNFIPIVSGLGTAFAGFRIAGLVQAVGGLGAVFGALGSVLAPVGAALGALMSPFILIPIAIGALVAGVIYAYQHFERFRTIVGGVATYVQEQFGHLVAFGREIWPQLQEAVTHVMNVIQEVITGTLNALRILWDMFGADIMIIVGGAFDVIKSIVETVINTIANVIRLVLAVINGDWDKAWNALVNIVKGVVTGVLGVVDGFTKMIGGVFMAGYHLLYNAVKGFFEAVADAAKLVIDGVYNIGKDIINGLIRGIRSAGEAIGGAVSAVVDKIPEGIRSFFRMGSPSRLMADLGKQIPAGLAKGINDNAGVVTSAMGALTDVGSVNFGMGTMPAAFGGASGGSNTAVTIGDIHISGASDPTDPAWQRELIGALRAGVGKG